MILTNQRDTAQYMATMEAAYRAKELALFYNIDSTSYAKSLVPGGYPTDNTTVPNDSVARVSGSTGSHTMGPALLLKVMSGDSVGIGVKSYYVGGGSAGSTSSSLPSILNALANGLVAAGGGGGHGTLSSLDNTSGSPVYAALNSFLPSKDSTPTGKPKAYLNWMLLDNQFNYVSGNNQSGAIPVGNANVLNTLATNIKLQHSGYLYIWVSNETQNWDVFFDNLSVATYSGPMLEEDHYYPFGLTMAGISDKALKTNYAENKYRWNKGSELQNKEFSDGSGLELYETPLRSLDPQLGRWWQIDPVFSNGVDGDDEVNEVIIEGLKSQSPYASMDNNPIRLDDPKGDYTCCVVQELVAALTGETGAGAAATAATTGSSGSTMGPGEAIVAALNPVGAWHGMVKAWNMIFPSSPTETAHPGTPSAPTTTATPGAPSAPTASTPAGAPTAPSGAAPAKAPQAVHEATGLPIPGKGKGGAPADQRDPKRVWTKTERQEQLDKQNGKCAQCGAEKTVDETQGHHMVRHADGGATTPDNHAEPCKECHVDIHKQ